MVVVKIELWPGGDEDRMEEIGRMEIINDGSSKKAEFGSYHVRMFKNLVGKPNEVWKSGVVKNFPRLKLGAYDLLYRALAACVKSRNPQTAQPGASQMNS